MASRAYRDEVTSILRPLQESPAPILEFRKAVFNVCEILSDEFATESRNVAGRVAHDIDEIPSLLLRLSDQAQDAGLRDVQTKCLDTWDLLLKNRIGSAKELLKEVDDLS